MLEKTEFLERLFASGVLMSTGVDGVYGRSGLFEGVIEGLDRVISDIGRDQRAEVMRFPPIMPRHILERSGYLNGFPHLTGTLHCFCGGPHEHQELLRLVAAGEDWTQDRPASDLVMTPAACYPVYPLIAERGPLAAGGHLVDVSSYCFRREPSRDPARMQTFRMREFVCIGTPDEVTGFRESWLDKGRRFAASLGLPAEIDVANDPFFGRGGQLMAASQRDQSLKFELLIAMTPGDKPTACMSFNCHLDHFAEIWDLRTADGALAHTACVGFGFERLALALLGQHGLDPTSWTNDVRSVLRLSS